MATLNLQVGASTDDALSRYTTDWLPTEVVIGCGNYNSTFNNWRSGTRFQNVTIQQGAIITDAYLTFRAYANESAATVNTNILAEDTDNAATFSTLADYNSRTRTSPVAWNNIGGWVAGNDYNSPSIVSLIQTVINRAGWSSGNALVIFWENNGSSSGAYRRPHSYDGSATYAPKLVITYTTGEVKTSGDSGSGAEAVSLRELGIAEEGNGIEQSLTAAVMLSGDGGSGLEMGGLLKGLFSQDEGSGADSIKILTNKAGCDLRLGNYQGRVSIPHKEVRL